MLSYVAHLTHKRGDDSDGANLVSCSVSQFFPLFATLCTEPAKLQCPRAFLNKNTGVGCHFLLQGIFLTQGIKPTSPVSPALQADSLPAEPFRVAPSRDVKRCVNKMTSHGGKSDKENKAGQ